MSVRTAVIQFLEAAVAAAATGTALDGAQVNDTPAPLYVKDYGVTVMDAAFVPVPKPGGGLGEYDGELHFIVYARVTGADKRNRNAAVDKATDVLMAASALFFNDPSIGGAVCDSRVARPGEKVRSDFDAIGSQPYAIYVAVLHYNERGYGSTI